MKVILVLALPVKEFQLGKISSSSKQIISYSTSSITALQEDLNRINDKMMALIRSDDNLYRLYEILVSVQGVGTVLARELLIVTNEFKNFTSANRFACYIGIAPFENTSGTSLHSKNRISKIGNRRLKSLFHMPALSSIRAKGEIRDYYNRKVAEGHLKTSVINAVKNKLVHRIFACINENRLYRKT
jgi:transposase